MRKETKKIMPMLLLSLLSCVWHFALMAQAPAAYVKEIETWHAERINELKAPDGWLNLAGLYWLQEGRNDFGSGVENTIVFPMGTIAASAGYFQRVGDKVTMEITGQAGVTVNGKATKEAVVFDKDPSGAPLVAIGDLRFTLIKRGEKIGIRLRDLNSPLLRKFKDVDRYPLDTVWRVSAVLQRPADAAQRIAITNVLGQTSEQKTPGKLVFTYRGSQYSLATMEEDGNLFVVFADGTTGRTTYQSGRFLQVPMPAGADGQTVIDFNKAYNPPCAFTAFATCPLPPKENVLPFDVEAGEKNFGK
jgi:uncharacterized protein (DUF1684 family)